MKITKSKLKQLIKEELNSLNEDRFGRRREAEMVPDVPGEVSGGAQIDFDDLAESLRLIMTELARTTDPVSRVESRQMAKEVLLGKMKLTVAVRKLIRGTRLTTQSMLDDPLAID
jgi:hypothetical protein